MIKILIPLCLITCLFSQTLPSHLPVSPTLIANTNAAILTASSALQTYMPCTGIHNIFTFPLFNKNSYLYDTISRLFVLLNQLKVELKPYNNVIVGNNNTVDGSYDLVFGSNNIVKGDNSWVFASNYKETNGKNGVLILNNWQIIQNQVQFIPFNPSAAISCVKETDMFNFWKKLCPTFKFFGI